MSCRLTSTWDEKNGRDVNTVVTYIEEEEECGALPENGVILLASERHETADNPYLTLSVCDLTSDVVIAAVDILCNAKHLELYNDKGDYLFTEEGVLVDTLHDNTSLYLLQKTLESPCKQLSVKLLSLQCKEQLFLLSVQVSTAFSRQVSSPLKLEPTIDMNKVKSMVSGQSLSKGAQNLMDVVENFQQTKGSLSSLQNFGMLMSMLPAMSQSPFSKDNVGIPPVNGDKPTITGAVPDCVPAETVNSGDRSRSLSNLDKSSNTDNEKLRVQCDSLQQYEGVCVDFPGRTIRSSSEKDYTVQNVETEMIPSGAPSKIVRDTITEGVGNTGDRRLQNPDLLGAKNLEQLEMRVTLKLQETEDKLMSVLDEKLAAIEHTLASKLDKILEKLEASIDK